MLKLIVRNVQVLFFCFLNNSIGTAQFLILGTSKMMVTCDRYVLLPYLTGT
jgi:hypothetical protein